MELAALLGIDPGVTAVIGSGGKTTLLRVLSERLPGRVLLCTSTHIYPFPGLPLLLDPTAAELKRALCENRVVCAGSLEAGTGKLTALRCSLRGLADYVLCEADGAKMLPLKAHDSYEPAIPQEAGRVIRMVGLSGLGKPIKEAVHRPTLFASRCGAETTDTVTVERLAAVLNAEGHGDLTFLHQIEGREQEAAALARLLDCPCVGGSLREGRFVSY